MQVVLQASTQVFLMGILYQIPEIILLVSFDCYSGLSLLVSVQFVAIVLAMVEIHRISKS